MSSIYDILSNTDGIQCPMCGNPDVYMLAGAVMENPDSIPVGGHLHISRLMACDICEQAFEVDDTLEKTLPKNGGFGVN